MSGVDIAFWTLSIIAVVSGWRVFQTDSMVRASFLLLLSFVAVAGIMLLLAAPYLGVATIFMMAVEMMVMALFMVMFMMNPAGLNPMSMVHQQPLAIGAGVVAFVGLSAAVLTSPLPDLPVPVDHRAIHDLGIEMLGGSMLIFESAGVALLSAMIGSVILSSRSGRFGAADEGSRPPALSEGGQPAGIVPEKKKGHGMGHEMKHDMANESADGVHDVHGAHGAHGAHGS
ncbi:MAG: NADH-quinone oxidoreductase subunit J [Pseudomonadota bacterium]|nr:NADH-quinone oxidoreductase subunit J [Pseudomonadota bacterium]